jgi:uncharacterized membrane protein YvbJ
MKRTLIIWTVVVVAIILVAVWVYRYFIEFKNSDVKSLIAAEASNYGDKKTATTIIHDSAKHILNSTSLTSQVRAYSNTKGIPKEKALVDAAVAQAQAYKYLNVA